MLQQTKKPGLGRSGTWVEQSPAGLPEGPSEYVPSTERVPEDEMRVVILGDGMPNGRTSQASSSVLVELGNGEKFIFDIGAEAAANLAALEISSAAVDKVFISDLQPDHFADLVALWIGGWTGGRKGPLRVWGPNGDGPELGTKAAIEGFRASSLWHLTSPIGEVAQGGSDLLVSEFDFRAENGLVFQENGVTIRSWPAVHALDGAVSYSLEWNGLKFVFDGDTYPNQWFDRYAQGADIATHKCLFPSADQPVEM